MNEQEEIKFFISIMRDHAIMHINSLTIYEQEKIQKAQEFFNKYNNYLNMYNNTNIANNKQQLLSTTIDFIKFKQNMLNDILTCNLKINLPPSFINHQINEAEDFVNTLNTNNSCSPVNNNPAFFMKKWISDAIGHIDSLISMLDQSETIIIDRLKKHKHIFSDLLKKANEIEDMIKKVGIRNNTFTLCNELIMELEDLIMTFNEIGKMLSRCCLGSMGTLSDMMTNHFIREHQHVIRIVKHCILGDEFLYKG